MARIVDKYQMGYDLVYGQPLQVDNRWRKIVLVNTTQYMLCCAALSNHVLKRGEAHVHYIADV